jgi:hypothetical protein
VVDVDSHVLAFPLFSHKRRYKMAKNESRRIAPALLESDRSSFAALKAVAGYAPANPAFALEKIVAAEAALNQAQTRAAQAEAAAAAARDEELARE